MRIKRFLHDRRGSPLAEFAIVLPVALILMMGLSDLAFQAYVQAILTGAMQKAGRDSTLQDNALAADAIDQKVETAVKAVAWTATFNPTRTNYDNYASTAGEPFYDTRYPDKKTGPYDGVCNHGEQFIDQNGNGKWDSDPGQDGQGLANDVTRYTMEVNYNRIFPIARLIGWDNQVRLTATTILKNQPYQKQTPPPTGICP